MSSIRASMEGELPELAEKLSRLSAIDKTGINNAIAEALRSGTIERFEGEKSPGRPKKVPKSAQTWYMQPPTSSELQDG